MHVGWTQVNTLFYFKDPSSCVFFFMSVNLLDGLIKCMKIYQDSVVDLDFELYSLFPDSQRDHQMIRIPSTFEFFLSFYLNYI